MPLTPKDWKSRPAELAPQAGETLAQWEARAAAYNTANPAQVTVVDDVAMKDVEVRLGDYTDGQVADAALDSQAYADQVAGNARTAAEAYVDAEIAALTRPVVIPFVKTGELTTAVGTRPLPLNTNGTLASFQARVAVKPDGQAIIVDVNKNGSTVFATQANRPTIPAGQHASSIVVPSVTSFAAGDYLTVDIDQVGVQPTEAISFVQWSSDSTAFNATTYSVTKPSASQVGDIWVTFIRARDTGTWSAPAGAGWTLLSSTTGFASSAKLYVFWRVDDGAPGPWTFSGTVAPAGGIFARKAVYRGQHITSPINANSAVGTAFTTTMNPAALTTTNNNVTIVEYAALDAARTTAAPPTDYTGRVGFDGTNTAERLAEMVQATAGAANSGSFTVSGGSTYGLIARVALRPEPAPAQWSPGEDLTLTMRYLET